MSVIDLLYVGAEIVVGFADADAAALSAQNEAARTVTYGWRDDRVLYTPV